MMENNLNKSTDNFINEIVSNDLQSNKIHAIQTRFPPEPNGYLHIGHAKAIALNFGLAAKYGGKVNLRFDDTNPTSEKEEYVQKIKEDIQWLGFRWDKECYTSDYFEDLYQLAIKLIEKGFAYVDDSTMQEIAHQRGVPTKAGQESAYRSRSVEENKLLFQQMKEGVFGDETKVLRAKIDMASPNMHLRDPVLYRIKHAQHQKTSSKWCIYPTYDFAHGQSDAIEGITHSICTLEFSPHRPLYDWLIKQLDLFPSRQYEFARLNLSHAVMSKKYIAKLIQEKLVQGWDDPRLPTISGLRRRGYTPKSIIDFCTKIGVQKRNALIDIGLLEFCLREHLNKIAIRRMVVLDPIKVVITNFPQDKVEYLDGINNPEDAQSNSRKIPFTKEIYIDREDFMEGTLPKKYFRLALGKVVRLKHSYIIQCDDVVRYANGRIKELHCSYAHNSKSGSDTSGLKAKGTLHWVSKQYAERISLNIYDRLFLSPEPTKEEEFTKHVNNNSCMRIENAMAEPALLQDAPSSHFQFLRKGYFYQDKPSTANSQAVCFNQVVSLRDSWTKKQRK